MLIRRYRIERRWGCVRADGSRYDHTKLIIDNDDVPTGGGRYVSVITIWLDPNDDEPRAGYSPESRDMMNAFAARVREIVARHGLGV